MPPARPTPVTMKSPIYPGTCRDKNHVQSLQSLNIVNPHSPGASAFPMARPFRSPMEIVADKNLWPEKILAILWYGGTMTCRHINWPVWWTTRR